MPSVRSKLQKSATWQVRGVAPCRWMRHPTATDVFDCHATREGREREREKARKRILPPPLHLSLPWLLLLPSPCSRGARPCPKHSLASTTLHRHPQRPSTTLSPSSPPPPSLFLLPLPDPSIPTSRILPHSPLPTPPTPAAPPPNSKGFWLISSLIKLTNEKDSLSCVTPYRDGFRAAEMPAHRLVKIELDAAEALAEFSRLAHLPHQRLTWSRKRKRSTRACSDGADELKAAEVVYSYGKKLKDSPVSDKEESYLFDSRVESPSSPLPSLQLSCSVMLGHGDSKIKSTVQTEGPPVGRTGSLPHKSKIEGIRPATLGTDPQKVAVRGNSTGSGNPSLLLSTVKTEPLHEPEIGTKHLKKAKSEHFGFSKARVKCLLNVALNELGVTREINIGAIHKPKVLLTDMEREARRLRRIQANRESARQTIRRKQILCEELTRKATILAAENESMKKRKERLIQDLHSLKNKNNQLKHQLGISNSDNSGVDCLEIELMGSSQTIDTTVLQVPTNLPRTGVPGHSAVRGMTVSQETQLHDTKQDDVIVTTPEKGKVTDRNAGSEISVSEVHASSDTAASEVVEEKSSQTSGRTCATGSACPSEEACGADIHNHDDKDGQQDVQENAGSHLPFHVRNSSLPFHGTSEFAKKPRCDELPATAVPPEELERYIIPIFPLALRYGFPYNNCDRAMPMKGSFPAQMYIGRKSFVTTLAAAEARRRRKELTRSKFPRIRPCHLQKSR